MTERLSVYISGPIGSGWRMRGNLDKGLDVGLEVWRKGHVPFIPHSLTPFVDRHSISYEDIMQYDLAWVEKCDAILRIPGESPGADREVQLAQSLGKLLFNNLDELPEVVSG